MIQTPNVMVPDAFSTNNMAQHKLVINISCTVTYKLCLQKGHLRKQKANHSSNVRKCHTSRNDPITLITLGHQ